MKLLSLLALFAATTLQAATPTNTPGATSTITLTATQTFTPTPSFSVSPTKTFTKTATPTWTPTISPTWSHSPTLTVTKTTSPTPSITLTATITVTATPTQTPVPFGQVGRQVQQNIPFTGDTATNVYNLTLAYPAASQMPFLSAYVYRIETGNVILKQNQIDFITQAFSSDPTKYPNLAVLWWTGSEGITLYDSAGSFQTGKQYDLAVSYMTGGTVTVSPTVTPTLTITPTFSASPTFTFSPTRTASRTITPSATPTRTPFD